MSLIKFPKVKQKKIFVTKQMKRVMNRTLRVHQGGALIVWSGQSRLGKTTTAAEMVRQLNVQYDPENLDAFRCVHYEVGQIPQWSGQEQKRGIRSLYHACIGRLDEGEYRTLPTEDLAKKLVYGLRRKKIQMIFVDEAGTLSLEAIRGMVLVRDVAEIEKWNLSITFIGMDDLPTKMCQIPQIEKRIHEWCYFEEYSLNELFEILSQLHTHFAALDLLKPEHLEQVKFIYDKFGGIPGEIVPFLTRLDHQEGKVTSGIDIRLLKAVYLSTQRDKERAVAASKNNYYANPSKAEAKAGGKK